MGNVLSLLYLGAFLAAGAGLARRLVPHSDVQERLVFASAFATALLAGLPALAADCRSGKGLGGFLPLVRKTLSAELERRVEELVQRRLAGEPVAYIIGEWEFYGPVSYTHLTLPTN